VDGKDKAMAADVTKCRFKESRPVRSIQSLPVGVPRGHRPTNL
jgi:hypothetical protein